MTAPVDFAQRIVDGTSFDSVDVDVVPIIFVPGVMGSRLSMPGGTDWDPDDQIKFAPWAVASFQARQRDLSVVSRPSVEIIRSLSALAQGEIAANVGLQDIAASLNGFALGVYESRGWAGVLWSFYGVFLSTIETAFNSGNAITNPVYAFGYDFRRSNFDSAQNLLTFIDTVLKRHPGSSQVIVVTHSMGGLVTRAAMVLNPGIKSNIRGVVHGAQPATGAVVAYRRMFTGATAELDGGAIPDRFLARVIGTDPVEYASLQAGLPGPMQLLPSHLYFQAGDPSSPWLRTNPQVDLSDIYAVYALPTSPGVMLPVVSDDPIGRIMVNAGLAVRIAEAAAFHEALGDTGHPNTHIVFSDKVKTDARVDFTHAKRFVQTPSGDGTVPAISGACLNIRKSLVKSRKAFDGLNHPEVYKDSVFNDTVIQKVALLLSARS